MRKLVALCCFALSSCLAVATAMAIEVVGLKDFKELHGRYAPGGDCQRQPQILVDAGGMTFEVGGTKERVTKLEYAASYGGNFYEGISQWFFPFGPEGDWPVIMTFNAGEKPGDLSIEGHGEGWQGGPPLTPRNKALVEGSVYRECGG